MCCVHNRVGEPGYRDLKRCVEVVVEVRACVLACVIISFNPLSSYIEILKFIYPISHVRFDEIRSLSSDGNAC